MKSRAPARMYALAGGLIGVVLIVLLGLDSENTARLIGRLIGGALFGALVGWGVAILRNRRA